MSYNLDVKKFFEFIETSVFTKRIHEIGGDDSLKALQETLIKNPEQGDVIRGTGGLRKIRIALSGKGKRGGGRVLYLFVEIKERIHLIYAYKKNELTDIPPEWKKRYRQLIKALREES